MESSSIWWKTQLHLYIKDPIFISVLQPDEGTNGANPFKSVKLRSRYNGETKIGTRSFFILCSPEPLLWDGDWGKELGSLLKWMCQLLFSLEGSALLIWIFTAICETPVHSIISDYNQAELSGVCFQVFVFLCHLKKYNGGKLSMEI